MTMINQAKTVPVYLSSSSSITLNKAVSSIPTLEDLHQLKSSKSILRCMYKKFYRLRDIIHEDTDIRLQYCNILRRKFNFENFNHRRNILLNIDSNHPIQSIDPNEFHQRLINTYAFVFNSTVQIDGPIIHKDQVIRQEDLEKSERKRIESSIILTILKLNHQMPNEIKLDFTFKWIDKINKVVQIINGPLSKKEHRKLADLIDPNYIGYRDLEISTMRLNESLKLCL